MCGNNCPLFLFIQVDMQINDLRIGNIVYMRKQIAEITTITEEIKIWLREGYIEPIPLTKEWLLKFSYEQKDHPHSKYFDKYILKNQKDSLIIYYYPKSKKFRAGQFKKTIYFVNQLQNLYFVLRDKELNLT